MVDSTLLNLKETALIVVDIQNAYCSPQGKMSKIGHNLINLDRVVDRIDSFIAAARNRNLPVIFTRYIEDPAYMKRNAQIKMKNVPNSKIVSPNTWDFEYYKVKPTKQDYQIVKKSYDAFSNPQLDKILKSKKIKNIIIVGAYSDMCVDMTLRSAYTKGYNVIVPYDLVSTIPKRKSTEKKIVKMWNDFFAHVVNSQEIMKSWSK